MRYLGKGNPLLEAIQKRFGKPDRVTRSERVFIHYDLPNGDTLVFVVQGAKVLDIKHRIKESKGDLLDAISSFTTLPSVGHGRTIQRARVRNTLN